MASELIGLKELQAKLKKLDGAVAEKALRQAVLNASTPAFKAAKAAAPVGSKAHRTYKGNLVAPGFLKRSIRRITTIKRGRYLTWASAIIGVKSEAFYGVQFLEKGTIKMSKRPWFVESFKSSRSQMEQKLKAELKSKIEKAIK